MKIKNILTSVAVAAVTLACTCLQAQQIPQSYYSANLFGTAASYNGAPGAFGNYNGASPSPAAPLVLNGLGNTNLIAANYDSTGGWFTTKGVTATDPNATGFTLQYIVSGYTNATATNLVTTFSTVLDDWSRTFKAPLYQAFTITNSIPLGTNISVNLTVQVPASYMNGAHYGKVTSINYTGSPLVFTSGRVGFWF